MVPGSVCNVSMKKILIGLAAVFYSSLGLAAQTSVQSIVPPALTDCNSSEFLSVLQAVPVNAAVVKDVRATWLNRSLIKWPTRAATDNFRLYYSAGGNIAAVPGSPVSGADGSLPLPVFNGNVPAQSQQRFKYLHDGVIVEVNPADLSRLPELQKQQLILVQENAQGVVLSASRLRTAGALDDLYADAKNTDDFGVTVSGASTQGTTQFKLWAPTAQAVSVCVYKNGTGDAARLAGLQWNEHTGIWSAKLPLNLTGSYYLYLVDVFVPGVGLVRNRVTDPYSISLTLDSTRSYITRFDDPAIVPPGWNKTAPAYANVLQRVKNQTDMAIYELHVRDFSANDQTVTAAHRGKYLAFTESGSNGMKHLAALAQAGMTDVHLLPVFDFASVPESGCVTPVIQTPQTGSSLAPQEAVMAVADTDCFNWGYDPYHYSAPEGSYASDAAQGATRMLEFRQMIQSLHNIGLRVGMDVVYNHSFAAGQQEKSVLDRIVPGYYYRLNGKGEVEQSTCCDNTATENLMTGKLMVDSVLSWAQNYKIDSFRFDLMGHQPRAVMQELQQELKRKTGRTIQLIGEGWNFGEVANGARFVQASQLSLNGSGIGTFNDRLRDAVRGGSESDSGADLINHQGYINGAANGATADMVRVGLAGSLRDYPLLTFDGTQKLLAEINYGGQPAGYVSAPAEVVNYVENHDNQTLFDVNAYKLPVDTSRVDRVRVQMLGAAIVAFSQGVPYFHAGLDILRSKSMDSNSFNSGDWFNRLDWSYQDNYFATGLPPEKDNGKDYDLMRPLLENALIKPTHAEIVLARDMFLDLLRIRASSSLFRMANAADIKQRLRFLNVGPAQNGALIVAHLDGVAQGKLYPGANYRSVLYLINVAGTAQAIALDTEKNKAYVLHPVQLSANAADKRIARVAIYDSVRGEFTVPARSAVVFVEP